MKATIEEQLKNITPEVAVLFAEILNCITSACNEAELRRGDGTYQDASLSVQRPVHIRLRLSSPVGQSSQQKK